MKLKLIFILSLTAISVHPVIAQKMFGSTYSPSQQVPESNSAEHQVRPSLQATEDWILSKINTYGFSTTSPYPEIDDKKNYKVSSRTCSFTSEMMVIDYYYEFETRDMVTHDGHDRELSITRYSGMYTITIPLRDISEYIVGQIHTYASTIKFQRTKATLDSNPDNGTRYDNEVDFSIDTSREENLRERLQKAFENLKFYFPKQKSNETF